MTSSDLCPEWDNRKQKYTQAYLRNLYKVAETAVNSVRRGSVLTMEQLCTYHRRINLNYLPLMCPKYYAGNVRQENEEMPCLNKLVEVDGHLGLHPSQVETALRDLIANYERQCGAIADLTDPRDKTEKIAVSTALLVGRFIKIHPFLNGNGTLSRLLMYIALERFGRRSTFRLAPRPGGDYSSLMERCMKEDYMLLAKYVFQTISRRENA